MNAIKPIFITICFLFVFSSVAHAGQPAYITNIYTCSKVVRLDGFPQPNEISNIWRANNPTLEFNIVINMILARKGDHTIQIDIYDPDGNIFDHINFNTTQATSNHHTFSLQGTCGGRYPEGMIILKIYDKFDGKRTKIMEQGILMRSW